MNKTILITGAAKRIGKEIALTYCEMDWNIIIHYNLEKVLVVNHMQKNNIQFLEAVRECKLPLEWVIHTLKELL